MLLIRIWFLDAIGTRTVKLAGLLGATHVEKTHRISFLMWQRKMPFMWIIKWQLYNGIIVVSGSEIGEQCKADWKLNIAWIEYNFVDLLWQILPSNMFSQAKFHISTTGAFSFLWILFIIYWWSSHLAFCFNHWALHSLLRWLKHYTTLNPSFIGLLSFISFGWDFLLWKLIV